MTKPLTIYLLVFITNVGGGRRALSPSAIRNETTSGSMMRSRGAIKCIEIINTYIHTYIHTHTHTHTYKHTHTRAHTHNHTYIHTHTHIHTYIHTHTHTHTHNHTYIHTHTHIQSHTHTHTHTQYTAAVFHQLELWKETCSSPNPDRAMGHLRSVSHKMKTIGTVVAVLIFHLRKKTSNNNYTACLNYVKRLYKLGVVHKVPIFVNFLTTIHHRKRHTWRRIPTRLTWRFFLFGERWMKYMQKHFLCSVIYYHLP
jgi:hypothetical protein